MRIVHNDSVSATSKAYRTRSSIVGSVIRTNLPITACCSCSVIEPQITLRAAIEGIGKFHGSTGQAIHCSFTEGAVEHTRAHARRRVIALVCIRNCCFGCVGEGFRGRNLNAFRICYCRHRAGFCRRSWGCHNHREAHCDCKEKCKGLAEKLFHKKNSFLETSSISTYKHHW